jgi:hypothetical protein
MLRFTLLGAVAAALLACSGPAAKGTGDGDASPPEAGVGGACTTPDGGEACTLPDEQVRTCAGVAGTGIYGAGVWSCVGSECPLPSSGCIDWGSLGATLPDGGAASVALSGGVYALALPPGSYDVCFDAGVTGGACGAVEVTSGPPSRVDINEQGSGGQVYYDLVPR